MDSGRRYIVTTHWGCFSLNEGAYRDYLAGKLWITWKPGDNTAGGINEERQALPPNVTKEALAWRDHAAKENLISILKTEFSGKMIAVPYKEYMGAVKVDEMNLNVRAYNGLIRAGIDTMGKLNKAMEREGGLSHIRNIGAKSIKEITEAFMEEAYHRLSVYERAIFWQEVLEQ